MIIYRPKISHHVYPLFLSRVPAGFPSPAEDYVEKTLDLNDYIQHPSSTFFLRCEGDSMEGAGIYSGDLLIVDRSKTARNRSIVVAIVRGEMTLKRLVCEQGVYYLAPENPLYERYVIQEGDEIWGVVINSVRNHE